MRIRYYILASLLLTALLWAVTQAEGQTCRSAGPQPEGAYLVPIIPTGI